MLLGPLLSPMLFKFILQRWEPFTTSSNAEARGHHESGRSTIFYGSLAMFFAEQVVYMSSEITVWSWSRAGLLLNINCREMWICMPYIEMKLTVSQFNLQLWDVVAF